MVKSKLLFLAKLFGYSLGLFALWSPVSQVYLSVLNYLISNMNPLYYNYVSGINALHIKEGTEYLIPFASLILAVPGISIGKKAGFLSAGILIFLFADFALFEYAISRHHMNSTTSAFFIFLMNVKLLVPFASWVIAYPYLVRIFRSQRGIGHPEAYLCPICEEEHSRIIDHIREVHGEKSLRIKKVRKLILENCELSVDSNP